MNENKLIEIMKIAFNPFRLISLFFLLISNFFGYFANFFDAINNKISINISKSENLIKESITISEKVGKYIIALLLIVLFVIWFDFINRG